MKAYLDTSCLATLALQDRGYEVLERWMEREPDVVYFSNFGWGEFVSATGRRVRATGASDAVGVQLLVTARTYMWDWNVETIEVNDVDRAASMLENFVLNLRFPDAIHIAVAARPECSLISTDRNQCRAAIANGIASINPLFDSR